MIERDVLQIALDNAVKKVDSCLDEFTFSFPGPMSSAYRYSPTPVLGWSDGFWCGILWLMHELTGDEKYKKTAEIQCDLFKIREEKDLKLEHHDIGFLYSLSCVAAYKITGEEKYKIVGVNAADKLCRRFQEKGGFLQAWGAMDREDSYRLIIDCLLNIPLLFWATDVTGNERYRYIAETHLNTAISNVIRDDFTTYHTYFFDRETGAPLKGVTAQGYSDDSCWARGQAWGIAGLAISYAYTKDEKLVPLFNGVTKKFIENLPADYIPYWDMIFTSGNEPRDTSAAAIAICGIYEMQKYHKNDDFMAAADKMLQSLMDNYTTCNMSYSNGLLKDAMNNRNRNHDSECNIWGDYFYMEAIARSMTDWKMYW